MAGLILLFNPEEASADTVEFKADGLNYVIDKKTMTASVISPVSEKMTELVVPDAITYEKKAVPVTEIAEYAFFESKLKTAVLGSNVVKIGEGAFAFSTKLKKVTIPKATEDIGDAAFAGCAKLKSTGIVKKSGIKWIGDGAFADTAITSFTVPSNTEYIGMAAFSGCAGLKKVVIYSKCRNIGDGAFSGCNALKKVTVSKKNKSYAFADGCLFSADKTVLVSALSAVGELEIPEGVLEIAPYAFEENTRVTSVILPESLLKIGECAFLDSEGLEKISFGSGLELIGENAFYGCTGLKTIAVLPGTEDTEGYPFEDNDGVIIIQG